MSMLGPAKSCVITILTDDKVSASVNLELAADWVAVTIPALTSTELSLQVSRDNVVFYTLGADLHTVAGVGGYTDLWWAGEAQYIKIVCSDSQAANRTFTVQAVKLN